MKRIRIQVDITNSDADNFQIFAIDNANGEVLLESGKLDGGTVVTSQGAPNHFWDASILIQGVIFDVNDDIQSIRIESCCTFSGITFDLGEGFDDAVRQIIEQPDGKIYVGGDFNTYKGVVENFIIRLNADGSKDTGFDNTTGFNDVVLQVVVDSNGKIYVGGTFSTYKGLTENRIIRLNPDGSKDTDFDNTTGFNGQLNIIVIDSNGKIYVGGTFTTYKGLTENRIIRLNPDGSKDTDFDNTTGFNSTALRIAIDSNGKVYIVGSFTTYKGATENRIIRLNPDGSKDTGFDNTTGFNDLPTAIATDSNGKIYVGGQFTTYKGVTENRIIRLNADGSKDTDFDNTTGFNSTVLRIAIDSNGKIYVGGSFTTYKGVTENRIIRLNPDGSKDTGFDNTTGFNGTVRKITVDSNGKIYVGGSFTSYKGVTANNIILLNPDGSIFEGSSAVECEVSKTYPVICSTESPTETPTETETLTETETETPTETETETETPTETETDTETPTETETDTPTIDCTLEYTIRIVDSTTPGETPTPTIDCTLEYTIRIVDNTEPGITQTPTETPTIDCTLDYTVRIIDSTEPGITQTATETETPTIDCTLEYTIRIVDSTTPEATQTPTETPTVTETLTESQTEDGFFAVTYSDGDDCSNVFTQEGFIDTPTIVVNTTKLYNSLLTQVAAGTYVVDGQSIVEVDLDGTIILLTLCD